MSKRRLSHLAIAASVGLSSAAASALAADPSPREIMDKVTLTRKLDGSEATIKMIKLRRERGTAGASATSTMATKLYDGGKTEKRIYRFLSPPTSRAPACWCSTTRRSRTTSGSTCRRCARPVASSARSAPRPSWGASSRTAIPQHSAARRVQLHPGEAGTVRRRDLLGDYAVPKTKEIARTPRATRGRPTG